MKSKILFSEGELDQNAPYHINVPFLRRVMANSNLFTDCDMHIAVHHIIDAEKKKQKYCKLHSHEVDEINLIIGNNNGKGLKYRITSDNGEYIVESPQALFIPKNTYHSSEAIYGSGIFICIVMQGIIKGNIK